jgi:hypothetical protein
MSKTIRSTFSLSVASAVLVLAMGSASAQQESTLTELVAAADPPSFGQPTEAVDAFKAALTAGDFDGVATLLGLDAAKLKDTEGAADTFAQMQKGATEQVVVADQGEQQIIELGNQLWPMPFPLAKSGDGKWAFDTYAGIEEVINRRVGENEGEAVATARAYVEAQEDYLAADRDDDGVREYAQKLISSPGSMDGLYWPADAGNGESPAGAFADEGQRANVEGNRGYYGYRFRVLTGQGDNVAGGAYDYVINDNMIAGFGLVAWPVTYAETGVHTYIVNKEGIVYQADLGAETEALVQSINRFDPDDSWQIATD